MNDLHPLVVHFPVALAVVWPLVDAAGLLLSRPDVSRTGVGLLGAAVVASLVATVTGQSAYDRAIAAGIGPDLLDTHGDGGGLVPWVLLALGVLRTAGVHRFGRPAHVGALIAGLAAAAWVGFVGHSGGELVYEHGVGVTPPAARGR